VTIWTRGFWKATSERVIRTVAGALIALVTVAGFSPRTADWLDIAATVGLAALVSLLFAILSNGVGKSGPALTESEQVIPPLPQPETGLEYIPERALNDDDKQ
jgi:hypothetical protein